MQAYWGIHMHTISLQNEKRQLETNLVVEQRIQNRETEGSIQSASDDEQDEDDSGSAVSNGDGSDDIFFECNTDLNRLSSTPLLTDGNTSTSGTPQNYETAQGVHQVALPHRTSWHSSFGSECPLCSRNRPLAVILSQHAFHSQTCNEPCHRLSG